MSVYINSWKYKSKKQADALMAFAKSHSVGITLIEKNSYEGRAQFILHTKKNLKDSTSFMRRLFMSEELVDEVVYLRTHSKRTSAYATYLNIEYCNADEWMTEMAMLGMSPSQTIKRKKDKVNETIELLIENGIQLDIAEEVVQHIT